MFPRFDFSDVQQKLSTQFRPWERSFQFWVRVADIYTGYKVLQLRVKFEKDVQKQEAMWENQHEHAAEKIYAMCSEMGGFFLKVAQVIGKPDLAPAAWVKRLVTLCDHAPATPFDVVQHVVEKELHTSLGEVFETFDPEPLGSASIAQVHRARLRGDKNDVVVKVQHPGTEDLMMTDIRNLQAFALYMQKTDIKFDLYSVTKEIEKQYTASSWCSYHNVCSFRLSWKAFLWLFIASFHNIILFHVLFLMMLILILESLPSYLFKIGYEFDFEREANAIERIRHFLCSNNKKSPVLVPRVMKNIVTRRVLVMEYIDGIPILNLGDEIAKRGIDANGRIALASKQKILSSLTLAYGQMILKSGFFHADPHPGNILICKGSEASQLLEFSIHVALLDYGQVKDLPDRLRLGYAKLVLDIADGDATGTAETFRELGIDTVSNCENVQEELFKLALSFPEELFSILRTIQILRGLSVGLGINYSCAEQWRPIAEEALLLSGRLEGRKMNTTRKRGFLKRLFSRSS
ncbi:putative aarF domain-containing protein kinase 1 [Cucurbita argyrosperma subsp. argyrosperma]|nr:putative aarF domain-containing protein kinase 1 [Cucurbita argyrosperma subsp. argyrosperma]